ncbi:hypothetical protein MRB53_039236 [Persea americana]|nr:hypothetical protein MRB53_039236 [Persea americana]
MLRQANHESKAGSRKKLKPRVTPEEAAKSTKHDPYNFIVDDKLKLDVLRPALGEVLIFDDPLQLSWHVRQEAFTSPTTITNPQEAQAGMVPIEIIKVGVLWRKTASKRRVQGPWREWGAILTRSQLYFFKDHHWVKGLEAQVKNHAKYSRRHKLLVFDPPVASLRRIW